MRQYVGEMRGHVLSDALWAVTRPDGSPVPRAERPALAALCTGQPQHGVTLRLTRPDGAHRVVQIDAVPLPAVDGAGPQVVVSYVDVTARVAAEEARRTREARFRATFEQAAVGIAHVSPDGRWLRVNDTLCAIVGYGRAELRARTFQDLTHPDDRAADLTGMARLLAGEIDTHALEQRYLHRDGTPRWVALTASLVRTDAGTPDYVIRVVADIGARKRAEEAARAAAEAALRVRDDILAAVSHDLKAPLASVKGWAQVLQQRAGRSAAPADARLGADLARIDGAATKMSRLINELLAAVQLQAGQALALETRPTDLVRLARRVAAEHQQASWSHHINVEALVPEVVGTWDAFRLERVLDNLLSNAVKYSPTSGAITVMVRPEGVDGALLEVQDKGLGIPAADLPHIFERFHRARNARGARGTGLGLAGARHIVEQHGGTIAIASREGAGTTLRVWLPRSRAGAAPPPPRDLSVS